MKGKPFQPCGSFHRNDEQFPMIFRKYIFPVCIRRHNGLENSFACQTEYVFVFPDYYKSSQLNFSQRFILFLKYLILFHRFRYCVVLFFLIMLKRKRFYTYIHLLAVQVLNAFRCIRRSFLWFVILPAGRDSCPSFTLIFHEAQMQNLQIC